MTLDEAIQHCKEVSEGGLCEGTINHKFSVEEHKQLYIWLSELKNLKKCEKN